MSILEKNQQKNYNPYTMSKFYITTSIAYVNGAPHIGFALESVQADAIARYHRQQDDQVFFLTGTDEHGAKISRTAEALKITPEELTDTNAAKFKALKELLNLSWDDFIRTSDKEKHWPNVVNLWHKLEARGDIYKKVYKGLYCVGHEAFVTEKDLVDGQCRDHQSKPEIIEEENYFFRLSKYADQIKSLIESEELKIYPQSRANEIISFINQGIEDISFSRPRKDLSWGIPVPGDETQTIYVWCDALSNYLSQPDQWPAELQIIGKDILRFHALFWPAMLLSAKLPLPKALFVHGHITVDNQKMSKSLGNVIDPVELVNRYGVDAVRYYLLREIPPFNDGDFSYKKFEERYNGDLANGLGNFVSRVFALQKRLEVSAADKSSDDVGDFIKRVREQMGSRMEQYRLNEALETLWELISRGDKYINEKKPWETGDKNAVANARELVDQVAELLKPFLPETAEKIIKGEPGTLFPRL